MINQINPLEKASKEKKLVSVSLDILKDQAFLEGKL